MRQRLTMTVAGLLAIAGWLGVFGTTARADLGIPTGETDLVELADGRVLSCRVGEEKDGRVALAFPSGTVTIAKARIARTRLARDFDSTPRDAADEAKVKQGLVKWDGQWIAPDKAAALRQAELDAAEAVRKETEAHALWENRWKVETEHFAVEANIPKAHLDYYMKLLEDYYEQLVKKFQVKLTAREKKKKLPVFFYGLRDQYWKRYKEDTGGKGEHTLGYFTPVPGREHLVLFDQPWGRDETLETLLHEGTHFILHLAEPQVLLPRWVHEGCAEYFSGARYEGGKFVSGQVQDGRLLNYHLMVQRKKTIPLDTIMQAAGYGGKSSEFDGWCYAQAWTMVHFFMHAQNGKYASKFTQYIQKHLSRQGVTYVPIPATARKFVKFEDDKALLLKLLGFKNGEELLQEVEAYAKTLPLRSARAYVYRGDMRFWIDKDPAGAKEDFDAALREGKDDARVYYDLAIAYSHMPGRQAEVFPLLQKALEVDPLDVGIRYEYAQAVKPEDAVPHLKLCTEIEPQRGGPAGDLAMLMYRDQLSECIKATEAQVPVAKEALDLATRATKYEPHHRHFDTRANLHLCLGQLAEAAAAEERAVEEEPENVDYVARRATLAAAIGDADGFAKTLGRAQLLLRRAEPDAKDNGRNALRPWLLRMAEICLAWDKTAEGVTAIKAWTTRRPPESEEDWIVSGTILASLGDKPGALEVAKQGKAAFPSSSELDRLVASLD